MWILGIRTLNVCYYIIWTHARKRINMSVSIISLKFSMLQPQNFTQIEHFPKHSFYAGFVKSCISLRRQQTTFCSKQSAFTICFYRPAFKDKIFLIYVITMQYACIFQFWIYGIIFICFEFVAPSIETEVKYIHSFSCNLWQHAAISCPCVIYGTFIKANISYTARR